MVTRGRLPLAGSWADGEADSGRVGAANAAPKANITPASAKQAVIFSICNPPLTLSGPTVSHPGLCRQPLGWRENLPYNVVMTSQFDDWQSLVAPSLADIETLAAEAYARLPEHFRKLCEGLVIRVEDFPAADVVDSMRLESDFDLLGLFQGVGLPFPKLATISDCLTTTSKRSKPAPHRPGLRSRKQMVIIRNRNW